MRSPAYACPVGAVPVRSTNFQAFRGTKRKQVIQERGDEDGVQERIHKTALRNTALHNGSEMAPSTRIALCACAYRWFTAFKKSACHAFVNDACQHELALNSVICFGSVKEHGEGEHACARSIAQLCCKIEEHAESAACCAVPLYTVHVSTFVFHAVPMRSPRHACLDSDMHWCTVS